MEDFQEFDFESSEIGACNRCGRKQRSGCTRNKGRFSFAVGVFKILLVGAYMATGMRGERMGALSDETERIRELTKQALYITLSTDLQKNAQRFEHFQKRMEKTFKPPEEQKLQMLEH